MGELDCDWWLKGNSKLGIVRWNYIVELQKGWRGGGRSGQ